MTPYEVFFFSSGAVEERGRREDLALIGRTSTSASRSAACCRWRSWRCAALVLAPAAFSVDTFPGRAAGVAAARQARSGVVILGIFAATFGAALETALSVRLLRFPVLRMAVGQVRASRAGAPASTSSCSSRSSLRRARRHDGSIPIKVTEYSIVFSAAALPLTYFPILVVSNDPDYMGEHTNGRFLNLDRDRRTSSSSSW